MSSDQALLLAMERAARRAGASLKQDFAALGRLTVSEKGVSDYVSEADVRAEAVIAEELARAFPSFGFWMEESGVAPGASGADDRFIVDPLDGTTNFLKGVPHFAVSIAAERAGRLRIGVVLDVMRDELFSAVRGQGARAGGSPIAVRSTALLNDAVIATGVPHRGRGDHPVFLRQLAGVMKEAAGIRRFGAAALDLAWVAAGRFDGFWESGLSAWDLAAGVLLIEEAGGRVTDQALGDQVLARGDVVAANEFLYPTFTRALGLPT